MQCSQTMRLNTLCKGMERHVDRPSNLRLLLITMDIFFIHSFIISFSSSRQFHWLFQYFSVWFVAQHVVPAKVTEVTIAAAVAAAATVTAEAATSKFEVDHICNYTRLCL